LDHEKAARGRSIAIDLPLKALIWEDGDGQTWLSYNHPAFLAQRHRLQGCGGAGEGRPGNEGLRQVRYRVTFRTAFPEGD
jgi:hypothetical protein